MTTTTTAPPDAPAKTKALTDKQLGELLALVKSVDSVELKLTVPQEYRYSALSALDIDPLEAQIRQVYFFDTPDLALDGHGVVVRARRSQRTGDDSVVKLRPVVPDQLPARLRKMPDFGVEVDAMPGGFVCSGSMKAKYPDPVVRSTLKGGKPIRKLFSKDQRAFFAEHAPGVSLDDLAILGPITCFKLKWLPKDFPRKMVAEMWNYPDGTRILELSTKCPPADTFQAAAETRAFLADKGLDLSGEQQTKTRTALEYFAQLLTSSA
jgi:hypothetical protein